MHFLIFLFVLLVAG